VVAPAVTGFLRGRFGEVEAVERFPRGEWSQAFGFRADGRDLVVRFSAHVEDFRKDEIAARFSRPGLPVPAVLEIGEAMGGRYCVTERVHGETLDGPAPDRLVRADALPALFAALDVLRDVEPPGPGFGVWGAGGSAPHASWREALLSVEAGPPRAVGWRAVLDSSPAHAATFDRGLALLRALAPDCPDVRHVVHADLTAGNVLVDGAAISGVVDWGSSLYGDPRFDVAGLAFWAPWHPGLDVPAEDDAPFVACLLRIGLEAMAYSAYLRRKDDLDDIAARLLEFA
jgi:hygromycin-B 4-O-kinase